MANELIYTSAPMGTISGRSGFCTVATTVGLSPRLIDALETCSVYRPVYEIGTPKAEQNPICIQHSVVSLPGWNGHLLTRSCFPGADYTGRSNKLSHHILLEDAELASGGPARQIRSLAVAKIWQTSWNAEPDAARPPLRLPLVPELSSSSCHAKRWEDTTGDPGWAGALAQAILDQPQRLAWIVFEPPGMELLELMA